LNRLEEAAIAKEEFERLFDFEVAGPLAQRGFSRSGKRLYGSMNLAQVSLIRSGGKMAMPGSICHILCCRLSLMRDRTEAVPKGFVPEPFDYPFKFLPIKLPVKLQYSPSNLNYQYERLIFQERTIEAVRHDLALVGSSIIERILPWAGNLTANVVRDELLTRGENAWCERMWIEDCERSDRWYNQAPGSLSRGSSRIAITDVSPRATPIIT
jgi:hypothetical protein